MVDTTKVESTTSATGENEITTNWFDSVETFEQLEIKKDLLRGIFGYGFEKPSIIQQKGIIPLVKRRDTIA